MRILLLAFLLVGCGQSLDTTTFADNEGDEHNTETNYNKIKDIEDCLNGDRPACKRAVSQGFLNVPLFIEDLAEANSIIIDGQTYGRLTANDERVIFRRSKTHYSYNGGNYHMATIVDVQIFNDNSVDIVPKWKYTFQTNWKFLELQPGTDASFKSKFSLLPDTNLEWKSHDSRSIHIELIGNVDVN